MTADDGGPNERPGPGGDGGSLWGSAVQTALPGPIRRSYAAKFALAIVLVVLLIVGIGALSYVQIQGIIEDDAENSLRSTATVQADSVSEWIAGMQSQAGGMAAADVYATGDPVRIRRHLTDSLQWASSDVTAVHYVDPETDEIVASTKSDYAGRQVTSAAPTWQDPIEEAVGEGNGSVGMSDSAYERNGRLLMAFARETRVGDGVVVVVGDAWTDSVKIWNDDSVEVFLDPDSSRGDEYDGENDRQLVVPRGQQRILSGANSVGDTEGIEGAQTETDDGYRVELAVPWSVQGVDPSFGHRMGSDVHVTEDHDGGDRDAKKAWFATHDTSWENPQTFAVVRLGE